MTAAYLHDVSDQPDGPPEPSVPAVTAGVLVKVMQQLARDSYAPDSNSWAGEHRTALNRLLHGLEYDLRVRRLRGPDDLELDGDWAHFVVGFYSTCPGTVTYNVGDRALDKALDPFRFACIMDGSAPCTPLRVSFPGEVFVVGAKCAEWLHEKTMRHDDSGYWWYPRKHYSLDVLRVRDLERRFLPAFPRGEHSPGGGHGHADEPVAGGRGPG
jgi:hypothetical protein